MKVLWLASWYPSKSSILNGDFIERHATAAALFNHTYVIHVVKDTTGASRVVREEKVYSSQLTAVVYYYPSFKKWGAWIDALLSNIWFVLLHLKGYRLYKKEHGIPQGILVQVGIKAGFIAWGLQKMAGIPYLLFERWSGFFAQAQPNFSNEPFLFRYLWKMVLRNARQLIVASHFFGRQLQDRYQAREYIVIPNFIDDQLFFPVERGEEASFCFIHISTLDHPKNFEQILEAFSIVRHKDHGSTLVVYGPVSEELLLLTRQLNIDGHVVYKGEVSHAAIAAALQQSDVLILYSRYETFGNVVIEANACGLPVIVSDWPVFHELVEEGINGAFVKMNDPVALAEKMLWMKNNVNQFDKTSIARMTKTRFGKEVVGALFDKAYKDHFTRSSIP